MLYPHFSMFVQHSFTWDGCCGGLLQTEMKSFSKPETIVLKQHFERKLVELEEEKRSLQVFSGAFYTFGESMCMCISLFKQGYIWRGLIFSSFIEYAYSPVLHCQYCLVLYRDVYGMLTSSKVQSFWKWLVDCVGGQRRTHGWTRVISDRIRWKYTEASGELQE